MPDWSQSKKGFELALNNIATIPFKSCSPNVCSLERAYLRSAAKCVQYLFNMTRMHHFQRPTVSSSSRGEYFKSVSIFFKIVSTYRLL